MSQYLLSRVNATKVRPAMKYFSLSLISTIGFVTLVACTSTTTTTEPVPTDPANAKQDKDKTAPKPNAPSPSASTSAPPAPEEPTQPEDPDATCASKPSQSGCFQCCAQNHMNGYQTYFEAALGCLCAADTCKTECEATLCGQQPKNADEACSKCIDEKSANCNEAVVSACEADKDCVAYDGCIGKSSCTDKQ